MKKTFWLVLSIFLTPRAFGLGPGVSGGGNVLVADFVSIATELFGIVPFADEERRALRAALGSAKIVTVSVLVDPVTNQPVPNQGKLIAWGSPGEIQLKTRTGNPADASFEQAMESGDTVAHLVIHELYRASGIADANGASPDDTFQISIGKYHLDRDSTGAPLKKESNYRLYAECRVTHCVQKGYVDPSFPDVVCEGNDPHLSLGWAHATVQVFKYAGTDLNQQHAGLLGINELKAAPAQRMEYENYNAIQISDGADRLTVLGNQSGGYRNFSIVYSTPGKPETTGHAEIETLGLWKSWAELELGHCYTLP